MLRLVCISAHGAGGRQRRRQGEEDDGDPGVIIDASSSLPPGRTSGGGGGRIYRGGGRFCSTMVFCSTMADDACGGDAGNNGGASGSGSGLGKKSGKNNTVSFTAKTSIMAAAGRILYAGDAGPQEALAAAQDSTLWRGLPAVPAGRQQMETEVVHVELKHGELLCAAFHDAHAHPAGAGGRLIGNSKPEAIQQRLRALSSTTSAAPVESSAADSSGTPSAGGAPHVAGLHHLDLRDCKGSAAVAQAVGERLGTLMRECGACGGSCSLFGIGVDRDLLTPAAGFQRTLDAAVREVVERSNIRSSHVPCSAALDSSTLPVTASPAPRVILRDIGGHAVVCNSAAVDWMLGREKDPSHVRNSTDAHPEVGVFNGLWVDRFNALRPSQPMYEPICVGLLEARRFGICAITDAFVPEHRLAPYQDVFARHAAHLPRVQLALGFRAEDEFASILDRVIAEHPALILQEASEAQQAAAARPAAALLSLTEAKLEIDGAFSMATAWSSVPYLASGPSQVGERTGEEEITSGRPRVSAAQVGKFVAACTDRGLGTHMHVMGELAAGCAAQKLAENTAAARVKPPPHNAPVGMHKLAHVGHANAARLAAALGPSRSSCAAILTPAWFSTQWSGAQRLPSSEHADIMPISALRDAGILVAFGSDWDVTTVNPLVGIEFAVRRCAMEARAAHSFLSVSATADSQGDPAAAANSVSGAKSEPFRAADRLTVAEAIDCYTQHAATSMGLQHVSGTIDVGKEASFVILSRDIFTCPTEHIHSARVTQFVLRGHDVTRSL